MADINVAPQQGPFSDQLVPRQADPLSANTGYQKPAAGVLGLAGKFLQGLAQGRVRKYAQEQEKANRTFQVLGAHVQNYLSDPNVDPASKSEVSGKFFKILASSTMDQLNETTKGKDSKESPGGKLAHGAKSLLEAFTGGQLKAEKPDVHSITDLLGSMQEGVSPEKQVQPRVQQSLDMMQQATAELSKDGRVPTEGEVRRHPLFQKAFGQLQSLVPDRADKLADQAVKGYDKAPGRGTHEALVDAAMNGPDSPPIKTSPPPSRSGQMPTVMRKEQPPSDPGVATGAAASTISGKKLLGAREMGLVKDTEVRSYDGKPVRVFAVQPGPGIQGGTYSIDGKLMSGPGDEYKAPSAPHYFSTTGKDGQVKYWVSDPSKPDTAKPVTQNGQPLTGEKAKTSKTIWKTEKNGNRVLQTLDPDTNTWSPSKDPHGQPIVSYDSQSKEWQRQHDQVHREVVAEYARYVKADADLEKEAAASVKSIDNAKDAGGNPLPDKEKQARKAALAQDITRRRKQAKTQTELMVQGITASVGLPGRAFADTEQLDQLDQIDSETDSASPWSDTDVEAARTP